MNKEILKAITTEMGLAILAVVVVLSMTACLVSGKWENAIEVNLDGSSVICLLSGYYDGIKVVSSNKCTAHIVKNGDVYDCTFDVSNDRKDFSLTESCKLAIN